uniref:Uncharacterized protein n=1 Tax=Rhizophora mucronata TaxID=61149 RepID=A0A2P2PJZ4_RHIMU
MNGEIILKENIYFSTEIIQNCRNVYQGAVNFKAMITDTLEMFGKRQQASNHWDFIFKGTTILSLSTQLENKITFSKAPINNINQKFKT